MRDSWKDKFWGYGEAMSTRDKIREAFSKHESDNEYSLATNLLRPRDFKDFVGNQEAVDLLKLTLFSAIERNEPCPHILLSGHSGGGKSTLAMIVASYQKGSFTQAMLPINYEEWKSLCCQIENGSVCLLDEVHLQRDPEIFYTVLEEGIFIFSGQRLKLPDFTCISATTELGMVKTPLRNRFSVSINLKPYTIEEMIEIVRRNMGKLSIPTSDLVMRKMAMASSMVPREANSLAMRVRDYCQLTKSDELSEEGISDILGLLRIAEDGLNSVHFQYLTLLKNTFKGERTGLNAIACSLGENPLTITAIVEPALLHRGLIVKTPRGRQISEDGIDRLDKPDVRVILE